MGLRRQSQFTLLPLLHRFKRDYRTAWSHPGSEQALYLSSPQRSKHPPFLSKRRSRQHRRKAGLQPFWGWKYFDWHYGQSKLHTEFQWSQPSTWFAGDILHITFIHAESLEHQPGSGSRTNSQAWTKTRTRTRELQTSHN